MTTQTTTQYIISRAVKCEWIESAIRFVANSKTDKTIILGDDMRYWVMPLRHAAYLEKRGYEYADWKNQI